jgi:hypothetical protein
VTAEINRSKYNQIDVFSQYTNFNQKLGDSILSKHNMLVRYILAEYESAKNSVSQENKNRNAQFKRNIRVSKELIELEIRNSIDGCKKEISELKSDEPIISQTFAVLIRNRENEYLKSYEKNKKDVIRIIKALKTDYQGFLRENTALRESLIEQEDDFPRISRLHSKLVGKYRKSVRKTFADIKVSEGGYLRQPN